MKKIFSILAVVIATVTLSESASAQLRSSYFMHNSNQRYEMNAALSPMRGYLALPAIGGFYTSLETNFLSADNFFYPNGEGNGVVTYMHKSVSAEEFLNRLPDVNSLAFDNNIQLFGMGNYFKGGFWSFGIRLRSESNIDVPKDFFAITKTLSHGTYDIGGMGFESSNFVEASLGYTFPVQDAFTLGFRAKVLLGLARVTSKINTLDVEIGEESYRADMAGTFHATVNGYNFEDIKGNLTVDSFIDHLTNFENFNTSNIKSVGVAFDAGIEWTFKDEQIRFSAAVNDLGFNSWHTNSTLCATIDNVAFAFEGYDFENNEVKFESPDNIVMQTTQETVEDKVALHTSYIVGCEYSFANDIVSVGVLWNNKHYENRKWNSIGGSVTLRPTRWLTASASYSLVNSVGLAGFALNLHPEMVNFFMGVDYIATKYGTANGGAIPIPLNQSSVNLSFGLTIPLGVRMF